MCVRNASYRRICCRIGATVSGGNPHASLCVMDRLVERFAAAEQQARARARLIRSRMTLAAKLLRSKGAERIWVFGSLAIGGHPHLESDVDLVVAGLPARGLMRTLIELEATLGAEVDVIRLEEASPSLVRRIECEGEALHVPE
jgi:predicted nucleotidyltransferase